MTDSEMREKIEDFHSDLNVFWQDNKSERYADLVDNVGIALAELDNKIAANEGVNNPDRKRDE